MGWFSKPKIENELGQYLPDSDAQPCTESEEIGARNRSQAKNS